MNPIDATERLERLERLKRSHAHGRSGSKMIRRKVPSTPIIPSRSLIPGVGVIYFIRCRDLNSVKIGTGIDPVKRLAACQTGCSAELVLLGICQGDYKREAELHKRFRRQHIRGEWFRINDDMMNYIMSLIEKDKQFFSTEEWIQL